MQFSCFYKVGGSCFPTANIACIWHNVFLRIQERIRNIFHNSCRFPSTRNTKINRLHSMCMSLLNYVFNSGVRVQTAGTRGSAFRGGLSSAVNLIAVERIIRVPAIRSINWTSSSLQMKKEADGGADSLVVKAMISLMWSLHGKPLLSMSHTGVRRRWVRRWPTGRNFLSTLTVICTIRWSCFTLSTWANYFRGCRNISIWSR